ncbi:MAG TPA: hypothetical protein VGX25_00550 [Actinophytocola sp.]|uniref:hypothetical protein n=1 Tax=Actinophytocola sp. TaxID=1872138 RepID=UPI002DDCB18E|nr:hypothetical protein [Actinophytocola sp.]HEV2777868.1 hypothetical protein [Actinophytocola sp.]
MTFYEQPEHELTDKERPLAAVIGMSEKIPCGFQIGIPMHVAHAIELVDELFTEHKLPSSTSCLVSCGCGNSTPSKV